MLKKLLYVLLVLALSLSIAVPIYAAITFNLVDYSCGGLIYKDYDNGGVSKIKPYVTTIASRQIDNISGSGDLYYNGTYQSHAYFASQNAMTGDNWGPSQLFYYGENYEIYGNHYGSDYTWTLSKGKFWDYASGSSYWPPI